MAASASVVIVRQPSGISRYDGALNLPQWAVCHRRSKIPQIAGPFPRLPARLERDAARASFFPNQLTSA
jgi:hypothetical protein